MSPACLYNKFAVKINNKHYEKSSSLGNKPLLPEKKKKNNNLISLLLLGIQYLENQLFNYYSIVLHTARNNSHSFSLFFLKGSPQLPEPNHI